MDDLVKAGFTVDVSRFQPVCGEAYVQQSKIQLKYTKKDAYFKKK